MVHALAFNHVIFLRSGWFCLVFLGSDIVHQKRSLSQTRHSALTKVSWLMSRLEETYSPVIEAPLFITHAVLVNIRTTSRHVWINSGWYLDEISTGLAADQGIKLWNLIQLGCTLPSSLSSPPICEILFGANFKESLGLAVSVTHEQIWGMSLIYCYKGHEIRAL